MSAYANDKGLTVKTEQFTAFCRELQSRFRSPEITFKKVIDHEIARVLERAIANTDQADETKIRARVENRTTFVINGQKWRTRNNKTGQGWRVPDAIWGEIQYKRARSLKRKLAKIGLTKNSFYLLAQKVGEEVKASGPAKNARATIDTRGGLNNVSVNRKATSSSYGVRIDNDMPILRWTNASRVFYAALAGRMGFYRRNLAAGVFNSMTAVGKKYRGIVVSDSGGKPL